MTEDSLATERMLDYSLSSELLKEVFSRSHLAGILLVAFPVK